jgi:predicted ATP-grasp superfamily ATP-dependent carboligase
MKNRKPVIIVLDDDRIPITLSVVRCLGMAHQGEIHVVTLGPEEYPVFRFSKYVRSFTRIHEQNEETVIQKLIELSQNVQADLLIPIRESTVLMLHHAKTKISDYVKLTPLPDAETLEIVRNKWLLYTWLFQNGFSSAEPVRYIDLIKDPVLVKKISYPVLIKPHLEAGGTGITVIHNENELRSFQPPKVCPIEELLVQPYIAGYDIDFSGFMLNGKILTYSIQRSIAKKEKFVYSRHIRFVHEAGLLETAARIVEKLNYSGVAHLDFRFDRNRQIYELVDFNPRFWRSILGSLNAGINFPWQVVLKSLNSEMKNSSFREIKYLAEINPVRIITSWNSLLRSDLLYNMYDPMPYLASIAYHFHFLKKRP